MRFSAIGGRAGLQARVTSSRRKALAPVAMPGAFMRWVVVASSQKLVADFPCPLMPSIFPLHFGLQLSWNRSSSQNSPDQWNCLLNAGMSIYESHSSVLLFVKFFSTHERFTPPPRAPPPRHAQHRRVSGAGAALHKDFRFGCGSAALC